MFQIMMEGFSLNLHQLIELSEEKIENTKMWVTWLLADLSLSQDPRVYFLASPPPSQHQHHHWTLYLSLVRITPLCWSSHQSTGERESWWVTSLTAGLPWSPEFCSPKFHIVSQPLIIFNWKSLLHNSDRLHLPRYYLYHSEEQLSLKPPGQDAPAPRHWFPRDIPMASASSIVPEAFFTWGQSGPWNPR